METKEELQEQEISFYYTSKTVATSIIMLNIMESIISLVITIFFMAIQLNTNEIATTNVISFLSIMFATILVVRRYAKKLDITLYFNAIQKQYPIKKYLLFVIFVIGISLLSSIGINLLTALLQVLHIDLSTPDFSFTSKISDNVTLVIMTCIIAPIFEELLFRGFILSSLKRYGDKFAILTTSLLFAMLHGNFIQAIPTFVMSLFLCYIVIKTNSLYSSIIIHFFNNTVAMLETGFTNNETVSTIILCIEITFMIISIIILIMQRDKLKEFLKARDEKKVSNFFGNWVAVLFLILMILVFITTIKII